MADEQNLLCDWLDPRAGDVIADLGTSTGLYPRTLYRHQPECHPIAIDLSLPMLQEARQRAIKEGCELTLLQANAEELPFFAGSLDALSCGGSLNEFYDPQKALYEARRVLKKDGRFFMMYLLEAETLAGRLLQKASSLGGIKFWSRDASFHLITRSGFHIEKEKQLGIVQFVFTARRRLALSAGTCASAWVVYCAPATKPWVSSPEKHRNRHTLLAAEQFLGVSTVHRDLQVTAAAHQRSRRTSVHNRHRFAQFP